jgi:hypothetical protein
MDDMTRWFKHVAVIAAWLGLGAPGVQAQPGYPSPVGAARQIGPLHYIPDQPPPDLSPGPVNPLVAPAGPPPSLNLPADHTNAFPTDGFPPETAGYASIGLLNLMRSPLSHRAIAFGDGNLNPVGRLPVVLELDNVVPHYNTGWKATVGYLFANEAIELTGFFQPDTTEFRERLAPGGHFFVPFFPPEATPPGFEGDRGLWRQADFVRVSYSGAVGSAELNYRRWNIGLSGVEWIMGIRYFYAQERVAILTDDDLFVQDVNGNPNPAFRATYAAMTHTNHVGPQFGFEWSEPIPFDPISWIWLTTTGKMSAGFNFVERSWRLTRADGLTGFDIHKNDILFGSVTELGAFLDFHLMERLRLRAGYQFLLGINFPDAAKQVTFDFTRQGQTGTDNGCIYWHGAVLELQFLF